MSSKILRTMLFLCVAVFSVSKAHATLIVGNIYTDGAGNEYEYVGSFDLAAGPHWSVANTLNGLEAAASIFGMDASQLALSAFIDNIIPGSGDLVNHSAWYDGFAGQIEILAEDIVADTNGNGLYDVAGDRSAYVEDRAFLDEHFNFVFKAKSTSVSEPSILAMFALAFAGLMIRRQKKTA